MIALLLSLVFAQTTDPAEDAVEDFAEDVADIREQVDDQIEMVDGLIDLLKAEAAAERDTGFQGPTLIEAEPSDPMDPPVPFLPEPPAATCDELDDCADEDESPVSIDG